MEVYIEPHLPRPQLVVVGHLPVAEAMARLGKGMGYAVTVMGMDATPDHFRVPTWCAIILTSRNSNRRRRRTWSLPPTATTMKMR